MRSCRQGRAGKLVVANHGTPFPGEIADMPLGRQVNLLRVLQEREVEPIGSNT
ncbi:sigma 54-interacting transcriptional regulator [Paraburkholderia antibiotica]|uniref:sigma 54-interacting transcriptional regulator n=1 Tax=Paraburkholderia antibiotica TaxID=2728839 RepID=UPI0038B2C092